MGIFEEPRTRTPEKPEDTGTIFETTRVDPAIVITMDKVFLIVTGVVARAGAVVSAAACGLEVSVLSGKGAACSVEIKFGIGSGVGAHCSCGP
jgi:hypothetical protein